MGGLFPFAYVGWVASFVPLASALTNPPAGAALVFVLAWLATWVSTGALVGAILVWGTVGGRVTVVIDSAALVSAKRSGHSA